MADISKITLPSGSTYDIKDTVARQMATGIMKIIGKTTTALTDGSTTNPITLITDPTTTPPTTESHTAVSGDTVIYGSKEYTWVVTDGTAHWVEFGDLTGLGNMAYVDQGTVTIKPKGSNSSSSVSFTGTTTDKVLGEATTFTASSSTVTFGTPTTGSAWTGYTAATTPKPSGTTRYMKATASGTAVGVATSADAITGLDPSFDTFVKSYPGTTSKLTTTTVTGVSGSTTASKATAGTAVAVATVDTAKTVATGSLGTETSTRSANTPMWGATVSNETLSFTFKPISTTSVTPAKSNGTITPYTFADVTVPKAASSATTVATGAVAANSSGATVMTGLGTATTASAVTGLGTPTTDTFAKTVSVTAQPTITLASESSSATGRVSYISAVTTSGTQDVSITPTTDTFIKALPTATAAAQTITVGTNDKVTAITGLGTATAAAQTFTGTQETYTVNPKTS